MSLADLYTESPAIFLRPRPLARSPGSFILLPLLPRPRPVKPLPAEVWSTVLSYVIDDVEEGRLGVPERRALLRDKWRLLFVCKPWVDVVLPLLYSRVHIFTVSSLEKFTTHLYTSDRRWDSIRRIPYSTPGRWVQTLDLSEVVVSHSAELLSIDSNLTRLFPVLPFLTSFHLTHEILLSNRALAALQGKDGIGELRSLKGFKVPVPGGQSVVQSFVSGSNPVIGLLRQCPRLEQLEITCMDAVNSELEGFIDLDLGSLEEEKEKGGESASPLLPPLNLPQLKFLCLSSIPISPLFLTLLRTPLPALRHLVVTPYSDGPTSLLNVLLATHGRNLISLRINTPRHLPISIDEVPPPSLLTYCPELHYLALDYPLPVLGLPNLELTEGESPRPHPLRVVTIPRPSTRFLREVEVSLPRLPTLTVVRARMVRWLRAGVSGKALEAGVQGEMHEWRRKLARKGVRLVDGEWRDPE
ncbi:hypothetical protein B0F90DRAFT_1667375 [Multifurca ochricompacta]|uniref:F-box domain-containing protein n=1 Tax=Multifurca ochricompacta TaxID=376703 RepID=A0AAD4M5Z0_9AGAM|nr:hypothetical protein B0F90DRAFT_1667375 [Multifurca ochricompacta]